jgi:riboflavin synthase
MFTGIVEAVGQVAEVGDGDELRRLTLTAPGDFLEGVEPGDSIAVDGACLTPVEVTGGSFRVELVASTLTRTVAGDYVEGSRANLERALKLGDRLDGHLVQGHVDGIGHVTQIEKSGDTHYLDVRLPSEVHAATILHGSITLNGVSLTVNRLEADDRIQVALIPHTWDHTNLSDLKIGDPVNVEGDLIGKYVGRLLRTDPGNDAGPSLHPERLRRMGY